MATIISTAANLTLLLAKKGKRVTLADLDIGGADIHILFGLMNPPLTLTDFLNRRVERLEDIAQALPVHSGLTLIPGSGDTLATANMPYAKKKRLIRHLKTFSPMPSSWTLGPERATSSWISSRWPTSMWPSPHPTPRRYWISAGSSSWPRSAESWCRFSREAHGRYSV